MNDKELAEFKRDLADVYEDRILTDSVVWQFHSFMICQSRDSFRYFRCHETMEFLDEELMEWWAEFLLTKGD